MSRYMSYQNAVFYWFLKIFICLFESPRSQWLGWIPGILGFLNSVNETWIEIAQNIELQKSFKMISNWNQFHGNSILKIHFLTFAWAFRWTDIIRQAFQIEPKDAPDNFNRQTPTHKRATHAISKIRRKFQNWVSRELNQNIDISIISTIHWVSSYFLK